MNKRDTLFIGLMLFALFFGAGNLIYPPFLGMEAGTSFWKAITGFIITGVGLPILAVAAIALVKGGATTLGNRVHPLFGLIFTAVVYLAIGPFFGIPRGANVAFEMGVKPFITGGSESLFLLGFTILFFGLVYWVCLNPSKIVDRVGQWLTPALLLCIAALCIASMFKLDQPLNAPSVKYESSPFFTGIIEGYLTMDTIAALAFGIIVITALREKGIQDQKQLLRYTVKTGLIAGLGLMLVYVFIGWMGAKMAAYGSFDNGTAILTTSSEMMFGSGGKILLGLIVSIACFTTCIGLITACGQYFTKLSSKFTYKSVVAIVTIISFLIANLGLNQIISISIPILVVIYPLTIVLIVLAFLHRYFKGSRKVYAGAMLLTGLSSIYDGLKLVGMESSFLNSLFSLLPLYEFGLGWIIPALLGGIGGFILEKTNKNGGTNLVKVPKKAS